MAAGQVASGVDFGNQQVTQPPGHEVGGICDAEALAVATNANVSLRVVQQWGGQYHCRTSFGGNIRRK
jgi:hypothetical protein